jgi:hypothetical protein
MVRVWKAPAIEMWTEMDSYLAGNAFLGAGILTQEYDWRTVRRQAHCPS